MSDKTFVLGKTSWHWKLMRFIWGFKQPQTFSHLCPYFWLSVFNIIIIIPLLPFKLMVKGIVWSFSKLIAGIEQHHQLSEDKFNTYIDDLIIDDDAQKAIIAWPKKRFEQLGHKLCSTYESPRNVRFWILLKERRYELKGVWISEEDSDKNALIAAKARMNKILKVIQPLLTAIMVMAAGALTALGLFGVYKLLAWIFTIEASDFNGFWHAAGIFGQVIGVVLLLGTAIVLICNKYDRYGSKSHWSIKVIGFIGWPFIAIIEVCSFLGRVIAEMYRNSCPPIDWE